MQLLVVRHARAEDRDAFAATGRPDSQRLLTAKGIRRMKRAVRGLRALVPSIDVLATSPFRRATETARIIADAYGSTSLVERAELAPGAEADLLLNWLASQKQIKVVCVVGHEPDLSDLLRILLSENRDRPRKLKKGSACLLNFEGVIAPRRAVLQWYQSSADLASHP